MSAALVLRPLFLPLAVATGALFLLVLDAFLPARRARLVGWLTAVLLGAVFLASFYVDLDGPAAYGAFVGTAWSTFLGRVFLGAGLLGAIGAVDFVCAQVPRRQGEYFLLILMSVVGMLLVAGARDLLLLVIAFELMGMPLYLLAAYAKTDATSVVGPARSPAAEAAIKLYLVGAASTALTLFGLSFVVGMLGSTRLDALAAAGPLEPVTVVGLLLVLSGMAFKLGLVPFHMWVPDTYQGAGTPFVAFLSVGPKAAGIAALTAIFHVGLGGQPGPWTTALAILALATMLVGNLLAVPQTDLRRLLGFSGVAQMGTVLVALATGGAAGLTTAAFFLAGYLFTNMGIFFVLHAVADSEGGRHDLAGMAGLAKRSPWMGLALLLFLLSLAGIPFVVGFWAKLYIFLAAARAGLVYLVVAGVLLAIVSLWYYMQVARAAFMTEPTIPAAPRVAGPVRAVILVCLLFVVGMGLWPRPFYEAAAAAGASLVSRGSAR